MSSFFNLIQGKSKCWSYKHGLVIVRASETSNVTFVSTLCVHAHLLIIDQLNTSQLITIFTTCTLTYLLAVVTPNMLYIKVTAFQLE